MAEKHITGGDKLRARLKEISASVGKGAALRVGFLEGAGKHTDSNLPIAAIAAIQEFGAPAAGIPPRPFMRTTVANHSKEWGDQLAVQLQINDYDAAKSLQAMGSVIKSEIQEEIIDIEAPALSPITIMLRKMRRDDQSLVVTGKTVGEAAARVAAGESVSGISTKPLIYSGQMKDAVAYEVKE